MEEFRLHLTEIGVMAVRFLILVLFMLGGLTRVVADALGIEQRRWARKLVDVLRSTASGFWLTTR